MTQTQTGYVIFVAAIGAMLGLLAVDVSNLHGWADANTPSFVGHVMAHLGTVIAAFVGGKLIPTIEK